MHVSRAAILIFALVLAACERTPLRDLDTGEPGPDEFAVIPAKPLTAPTDFTALPSPTPGGSNLTDQNPLGDAVAALGGRADALVPAGVPSTDGALLSYVSRNGVPQDIRRTLATEDEAFRKRRGFLLNVKLVRTDRYNDVYRRQFLDQHRELNRWRRAGARTPTAPPG